MKWKQLILIALTAMTLTASSATSASATTLEVGGVAQTATLTWRFELVKGTTLTVSRTDGSFANTCTEWLIHGDTTTFFGFIIWSKITTWDYTNCSRPVSVHKVGELGIQYTSGTNGTVSSTGAEVTVGSPFGTLNCKTGEGTHFGTLTGVSSGEATLHVNAVLNCGFLVPSAKWEATLSASTPSGLGVVS